MNAESRALLKLICDAIIEAIGTTDQGVPGGPLYATLMPYGITLEQFETIMSTLVAVGQLRKEGQLYFRVRA